MTKHHKINLVVNNLPDIFCRECERALNTWVMMNISEDRLQGSSRWENGQCPERYAGLRTTFKNMQSTD
jgi:hypothetical protein